MSLSSYLVIYREILFGGIEMKILRYNPTLNQITGGALSTLVMLQLEHWFGVTGNATFYKFLEPCKCLQYRSGDSWVEELGISKLEFRTAFSKIGKVYKSKKAFKESTDPFGGMMYVAYYDRVQRLTYYIRNTKLVEEKLAEVESKEQTQDVSQASEHTQIKNTDSQEQQDNVESHVLTFPEVMEPTFLEQDKLVEESKPTFLEIREDDLHKEATPASRNEGTDFPISLDNNKRLQTKITTEKDNAQEYLTQTPYQQMVKLYHDICPHLMPITQLSYKLRERLDHLWHTCQITLEVFESMLVKVKENSFLSGYQQGKTWKANLEWIVQEDKFWGILEGKYDTYKKSSSQERRSRFTEISSHNWDFEKLEELEANYIQETALDPIVANSPLMEKLYEARRKEAESIQMRSVCCV